MDSINKRFKELRKALCKSQREIGEAIGLSDSGISNIESGARKVTDKHVKLLRAVFNVSENWLRTGEGEMFNQYEDLVDEINAESGLDEIDRLIFKAYLSVPRETRAAIKPFLLAFAKELLAVNTEQGVY